MAILNIEGVKKEYAEKITTFEQVANEYQSKYDGTIALVTENGKIRELFKRVSKDANIDFILLNNPIGHKTYARSAIMLLVKAYYDVLGKKGDERVMVEFVVGNGYIRTCYCVNSHRSFTSRYR